LVTAAETSHAFCHLFAFAECSTMTGPGEITLLLHRAGNPHDREAREQLFLCVEHELRHMAMARLRNLPSDSTLQTTELIDDAFMRLVNSYQGEWIDRGQFFRVASGVMRRILCDHARRDVQRRRVVKLEADAQDRLVDDRPPPGQALEWQELLLALLEALGKLEEEDAEAAAVFELRFFGRQGLVVGLMPGEFRLTQPGRELLPFREVASVFGIPRATAFAQWSRAVQKLQVQLQAFAPETIEDPPAHGD
jgi:RNA polymerase sigma factor (TIGR02999 family)